MALTDDRSLPAGTLLPGADRRLVGDDAEPLDERLYRRLVFLRRFEERLLALFEEGVLNGTTHACIGQEADAVAVAEWLEPGDHTFSNHRCHGHYLAQTGDAVGLLAEIMGRRSGRCGGLGGSQHVCAPGFASNGVLGGTVPAAAGIALGVQLDGSDRVSVAFIGDGTLGEGVVYETLNLASLWRLPLLVVCEDNAWAQSTPQHLNLAGRAADRFTAFGVPVREVETTDVVELRSVAAEEVAATRGGGPRALLVHTYRLCHHSKSDDARPRDEVEARWALDPLAVHGRRLDAAVRARIEAEVADGVEDAVTEARRSP